MPNLADDTRSIYELLLDKLVGIQTAIENQGVGVYQPLDEDLTAIAALATAPFGRGLLTLLDQAALQAAVGATEYTPSTLQPADHNMLGWTVDPMTALGTLQLVSGEIWVHRLIAKESGPVDSVVAAIQANASGVNAAQTDIALLNSSGAVLIRGNSQTGPNFTNTGVVAFPFTGNVNVTKGSHYYVATLLTATTPATLRRVNFNNTVMPTIGQGAGQYRFATSSGGKTAIPASIDLTTYSRGQNAIFFGLANNNFYP